MENDNNTAEVVVGAVAGAMNFHIKALLFDQGGLTNVVPLVVR